MLLILILVVPKCIALWILLLLLIPLIWLDLWLITSCWHTLVLLWRCLIHLKYKCFVSLMSLKNIKITYLLLCLSILITSEWICILFRCSSKRILCSSGSRVLLLICHWISTLNRLIIDLTIVIFVHFLFNVLIKFILLFKSLSIKFFPRN